MIDFFNKQIRLFTSLSNWKLILALLAPLISVFFSYPGINSVDHYYLPFFDFVSEPLSPHFFPSESTYSKLTFRLLPIIIVKILNLNILGIIIWQYLNGIILCYLFSTLILRTTNSNEITFLTTLTFLFIFTGKVSFINLKPNFDSLALIFYCLYLLTNNKIFKLFIIFLVCWIDERAIIASFLLVTFDIFTFINFRKLEIKKNLLSLFYLFPFIIYAILRFILSEKYGLKSSSGGISFKILATNFNLFTIGIWQAFEGFWLIVIYTFYIVIQSNKLKDKLLFSFILFIALIITFVSNLVYDVSRSLVYLFPLLLICLIFLTDKISNKLILSITKYSCLISFLYPSYIIGGPKIEWMKPYFLNLIFQFFTNS
jgi:hypothetical protein